MNDDDANSKLLRRKFVGFSRVVCSLLEMPRRADSTDIRSPESNPI